MPDSSAPAVTDSTTYRAAGAGLDALPDEPRRVLASQCEGWLRGYASMKTRTGYAERLGIPRHWIPGRAEPSGRGRRPRGYTGYEWLLWCLHHRVPYTQPTRDDLNRWLDELEKAKDDKGRERFSQRTRAAMLSSVSSFYVHLLREGVVETNPTERVDRAALGLRPPKKSRAGSPLTHEQTRALLEAAWRVRHHTRNGLRDRAMVELLVLTGLRAHELVRLTRADYRRPSPGARGALHITGKGSVSRVVGVPVEVCDAIDDYQASRPDVGAVVVAGQSGGRTRQPLFTTASGEPLHVSHVGPMLGRLVGVFAPEKAPRERWRRDLLTSADGERLAAVLAPLRGKLGPHRLRHSYGTHALTSGVPQRQVQRDLGHASVDTTEAYLHDEHQAEHSASHELSPALHRGWLVSASLVPSGTGSPSGARYRANWPRR